MNEMIERVAAAIESLREPTEEMKKAMVEAAVEASHRNLETLGDSRYAEAIIALGGGRIYDAIWRAAIEEALGPSPLAQVIGDG